MDEIEKIKRLINKLEDRIEELETENRALKMSIKQACTSLMRQNDDAKETIQESERLLSFSPTFNKPKWKKQ
jgi:chromosome segregation ATPase